MASSARIDELRKKFDENPRRYFAPLANEYRKAGDLEQAVFICQEYLPQQPGHMSGHIVYGQTLYEMGRHDEAKAVFETALSLDPENLIALRHLGDIARQTGEPNAARIWYQRVLEADPRNEEIAQLMISLLALPAATPPSAASGVPSPRVTPAAAPRAGTDDVPAMRDDANAALHIEKTESVVDLASHSSAPNAEFPPPLPSPASLMDSSKAGDGHDFLDLADFSVGGAPAPASDAPSSERVDLAETDIEHVEADAGVHAPVAIDAPEDPRSADEGPLDDAGFDLGNEDGPFEADPYAIAAAPPAPVVEAATDLRLGLVADASAHERPRSDTPAATIDGLQTFEPGVLEAAVSFEPVETDGFIDETSIGLAADDELGIVAHDAQPSPLAAEGFVTETMAELYLEQGHLDSALDIYQRLVQQRPEDPGLRERLRAVERQTLGAQPAPSGDGAEQPAPVYGGPSIRDFLTALVRRPGTAGPVDMAEPPSDAVDEPVGASPSPEVSGGELARADSAPMSRRMTPVSEDTVRGSLDALFTEADAASPTGTGVDSHQSLPVDASLESDPLHGTPAHRASNELSLDHVFKGNSHPRGEPNDFSFDQFFSEDMTDAPSAGNLPGGVAPTDPSDDIAQFNAWLNGLKKT